MAQDVDITSSYKLDADQTKGYAPPNATPSNERPEHTKITGRFNQYTSGYWALALPALAARYIARYGIKFFTKKEITPEIAALHEKVYSGFVGAWMGTITAIYLVRTYRDMKKVFSETLAYEFDKNPKDVTYRDFARSENILVKRTLKNFKFRNFFRTLVAGSFFARFIPAAPFQRADSVDLGVGAAGGYLVSDVMFRKETFFERLQSVIDQKINHTDHVGEIITSADLESLYSIHVRDNNGFVKPVPVRLDSQEWRNHEALFSRMANLMNQKYGNIPNKEKANFDIPKLIYLLGNGLIQPQKMDESLAYIETANRYDMKTVKKMIAAVKSGMSVTDFIAQNNLDLPPLKQEEAVLTAEQPAGKFAAQVAETRSAARPVTPPLASQTEKLAQQNAAGATASIA